MRALFILLLSFCTLNIHAQTKEIFTQSHSGSLQETTASTPGNFGVILEIQRPMLMGTVIKVDSNTVVFVNNMLDGDSLRTFIDTVRGEQATYWIGHYKLDSIPTSLTTPFPQLEPIHEVPKYDTISPASRSGFNSIHGCIFSLILLCSSLFIYYYRQEKSNERG